MYVCVNWKEAKYSDEKRIEFDKIPYYNNHNGTIIFLRFIIDGFVISLISSLFVIPVKTGIQSFQMVKRSWIPAYAGLTDFL